MFQSLVAGARIRDLPRLVVFAAEDDQIVVGMRFHPQVLIGRRGVPEQRVRDGPARGASSHDVAGIEREFGLKERGACHAGDTDQGIVCRDHDIPAAHEVAVRLHRERIAEELIRRRVFIDLAALRMNGRQESGGILAWVKARLVVEADARAADERHVRRERGVETELARHACFVPERLGVLRARLATRRVQVTVHSLERAVDFMVTGEGLNPRDRGQPRIP